ncbi:double-strand break repair protein AddB [Falsiroseomonas sp. CW058]|uniref:double-strand break repair protein AddB n=1 Tax=Falsiroseomonas sp. CW058 TaxID=3388664 RepID=UPI003D321D67
MRLYDIPAHLPFLDCLAAGVLEGMRDRPPEALARATILLPTRRSARALRDAFLREAGHAALLLPRMRALAGLSTEDADELALPSLLDLPPAVPALTRQAVLTGYVMRQPRRFGGPATPEQAWQLAGELGRLFDEVALEETDPALLASGDPLTFAEAWLARLETLVPEEQATHWQITVAFLRGVAQQWVGWLTEQGLLDIGLRRVLALRAQARAWQDDPPADPVIAAGIGVGGTIPAAVELLKVVAALPQGCVVLHGLDRRALGRVWAAVKDAPTHPLSSQARLLEAMEADNTRILRWPGCAAVATHPVPEARAALLEMALRPPEGMEPWSRPEPETWRAGLPGLQLLAAPDGQAEAAAVALLLREALERPGARAALVTPDRDLARRVSAELTRHGILADDSAGEGLGTTPAGAFLRLVARMVAEDFAPVPTLAALKHPLCAAGMERDAWLAAIRLLERRALRGPRPMGGLGGLRRAAIAGLREEALARVLLALDALDAALGDFAALSGARPPADLLDAHMAAAEALAATPARPGGLRLYAGEEGEVLANHLADLAPAMARLPPLDARAWPAMFDAALEGVAARTRRTARGRDLAAHPRVEILGLLEARLLSFDRVVLGALDETVWPLATDPGPWMSRPMRAQFGLPEPEARIGRVCMDFLLSACAAPDAILSRAARRGGAPTVPARWLTRIETFLSGQALALPRSEAARWAAALDQPAAPPQPVQRPAPVPPRHMRPDAISVTEVPELLADPYAFYAKRILRLRALDPLDADVGALDYGQIVHGALAAFVNRIGAAPGGWPGGEEAGAIWAEAAEAALAAQGPRPALAAFWRPRLARIGAFVIAEEAKLREGGHIAASFTERKGEWVLKRPRGEVVLKARADRIDRLGDGSLMVLDYKTGSVPNEAALLDGTAPQLPLEAAMALRGAFEGVPVAPVRALTYWRLTGGQEPGEVKPMMAEAEDVERVAEDSLDRLGRLVDRFLLGDAAFPARPHPARAPKGGDFDHLARIAEWAHAEDDAE